MYIQRTIENTIRQASDFFPVVLITGPRQVGKTTVFQSCESATRTYVSLDTLENRNLAQTDPALFLQRFKAPVLIDEIQYAPELFPYIKDIVDREKKTGMYWLTGSQQFLLMKNVSESLAGRVGILKLQGFSQQEKNNNADVMPFLPSINFLEKANKTTKKEDILDIFHKIWKGTYPKLHISDDKNWELFYSSYVQTYIEKDIREILKITNEMDFLKFMKSLAVRTGQLLNYLDISRDIGISQTSVKSWVSLLQTTGLIYLLQPYSNNLTNRIVKTPKIYFMDTGLAAYLSGWKTSETLETGAMNGAFLENYVISEILKSYWHNGKEVNIFFYRDKDMKEIDILLEENNMLYPIEIKKKSNPTKQDVKNFSVLQKFGKEIAEGGVLCFAQTHLPITANINAIPIAYL